MPPFVWSLGWVLAIVFGLVLFCFVLWVIACYWQDFRRSLRRRRAGASCTENGTPARRTHDVPARPMGPQNLTNVVPIRRMTENERELLQEWLDVNREIEAYKADKKWERPGA